MRSVNRLLPVVLVGVMATAAFGQIIPGDPSSYPSVSIINTPHNLNNYPGLTLPGEQVCLPCHTPHAALIPGEDNVLWNHEETGETFLMYSSSAIGQPTGPSKMCLSCHDGVTAIDSYGTTAGSVVLDPLSPANLGTDLTDDHPIAIEYPVGQPGYNDPATFELGIDNGPGVQLVDIGGVDRVECTSCHHVHNNGLGDFLRIPIEQSWICLQCHDK